MDKLYVIKIGGNIIDDEKKLSSFLRSFAAIDEKKILVHGGGKLATKLAEKMGIEQKLVEGRRITDAETLKNLKVVTKKKPTEAQLADLRFAWIVAQFVKSNAIVFCRDGMTLGIGAGQMSRVDSSRLARLKAEATGMKLANCVAASDAFFPFRDGVEVLLDAGATAIIQPGGSVRDAEVIAAADERGAVMVFTGVRHFRH